MDGMLGATPGSCQNWRCCCVQSPEQKSILVRRRRLGVAPRPVLDRTATHGTFIPLLGSIEPSSAPRAPGPEIEGRRDASGIDRLARNPGAARHVQHRVIVRDEDGLQIQRQGEQGSVGNAQPAQISRIGGNILDFLHLVTRCLP
jgi:hypothetical protein